VTEKEREREREREEGRERERLDMRQTQPNFTCNFAVVGDPQRENAEVFNYIYPVEPVGRILTGNHSDRSYEPLLSTLCVLLLAAYRPRVGRRVTRGDKTKFFDG